MHERLGGPIWGTKRHSLLSLSRARSTWRPGPVRRKAAAVPARDMLDNRDAVVGPLARTAHLALEHKDVPLSQLRAMDERSLYWQNPKRSAGSSDTSGARRTSGGSIAR